MLVLLLEQATPTTAAMPERPSLPSSIILLMVCPAGFARTTEWSERVRH